MDNIFHLSTKFFLFTKADPNLDLILKEIRESKATQLAQQNILEQVSFINQSVKSVCEKVEKVSNTVNYLTSELNILKQEKLINNIVLSGIPESKSENLVVLFIKIANSVGIPDIDQNEFEVNRIKIKDQESFCILVKFKNTSRKQEFLNKSKDNGIFAMQFGLTQESDKQIFIQQQLTLLNLKLIKEARELKKKNKIKYVWFQNNCVLIRETDNSKIEKIRTKSDIDKFENLTDAIKNKTNLAVQSTPETTRKPINLRSKKVK